MFFDKKNINDKKEDNSLNIFNKQEKFIEKNFENFIANNWSLQLGDSGLFLDNPLKDIEFDTVRTLLDKCINELESHRALRVCEFRYFGYTGGDDKVDYSVSFLNILSPNSQVYNYFFKNVVSVEDIKYILDNIYELEDIPEFFKIKQIKLSSELKNFSIDLKTLDTSSCDNWIVDEFLKKYEKKNYGFKVDVFHPVGYEEKYIICNPDVAINNVKLIYLFLQKFYEHCLDKGTLISDILNIEDIAKVLPFVTKDKKFVKQLIAFNNDYTKEISKEYIWEGMVVKELLLEALELEPECYMFFSPSKQKDIDICQKTINCSKSMHIVSIVMKNGPIAQQEWKDILVNKLEEER